MQWFSWKTCRTPASWNNAHSPVHEGRSRWSAAKSKDSVEFVFEVATGLKDWPRRLRRLPCSLDLARNDGDIMVSSPKSSPPLLAGGRPANPPCFPWCHVEVLFALGWHALLHCERTRRRFRYRRLKTNGKDRLDVLPPPLRPCQAQACDAWNVGREHLGKNKSRRSNHAQAGVRRPLQQRDIAQL